VRRLTTGRGRAVLDLAQHGIEIRSGTISATREDSTQFLGYDLTQQNQIGYFAFFDRALGRIRTKPSGSVYGRHAKRVQRGNPGLHLEL